MKLAPIVLFTYNRLKHTQQTVDALHKNSLAENSELIIYSDGAKNVDSEKDVQAVRSYLKTIKDFKKVEIVEREKNYGLSHSIVSGVNEVVNAYNKIIVLEDDLTTAPYFLKYMNDGLTTYENNDKVASINAFFLAVKTKLPETFFLNFADCLGWATWKRAWDVYEPNGQVLLNQIIETGLQNKFDLNGAYPYTQLLKNQVEGKTNSWAIRWYASTFLKNKLSLCPGKSLVYHNGNDGTGTNFNTSNLLDVKLYNYPVDIKNIPVVEEPKGYKAMENHFKNHQKRKPSLKHFIGMHINKISSLIAKNK